VKGFVVVLVLIGFSACASGPYWNKAGVSRMELAQDDGACQREAHAGQGLPMAKRIVSARPQPIEQILAYGHHRRRQIGVR